MNAGSNSQSRGSPRREWLVLGLALVALGAAIGLQLRLEHVKVAVTERERLARLGHIVNDAVEARFVAIYKTLGAMRANARHLTRPADLNAHTHDLQVLGDAMQGVRTLIILDEQGTVVSSSRPELIGRDFSQRSYFMAARADNNPAALYLSAPYTTLLGAYAMQMSRVITNDQGRFGGIVAATLDPNYFHTLLDSLRYSEDMWVAVAHGSGTQFMMVPDRPGMTGRNLAVPDSFFTRHIQSGAAESILTGFVHATGEDRLMAIRTIQPESLHMDQKLVIAVGRDVAAMYSAWRKDAIEYLLGYLLLAVASLTGLRLFQKRRKAIIEMDAKQQAELESREQRFRDIVEASADWIWEIDTQNRYTFVSESVRDLLGYAPAEILGRTPFDLMPPDEADRVSRIWSDIASRSEAFRDLENLTVCKDGTLRHVMTSGRPVFDSAGVLIGYRGLDRDVSDQKEAQEIHLREEALKRAILDSVSANIAVLDRNGVIVDINSAWLQFGRNNGVRPTEWRGINYLDAIQHGPEGPSEGAGSAVRGIAAVLSGEVSLFTLEYPCHSPDTERWFCMTATPLARSEGGVVIAHTDITQRRQDETKMRTLSAATEQSPNSVIITDPLGRIGYVNQAFCSITGYEREEVIGQHARMLRSPETPIETIRSLAAAISAGKPWLGELHNRRRDGHVGIDASHIAPVRDIDGHITHFVGVQEDVTEQRRISMELEIHREHLEYIVAERTSELRATETRLKLLINSTADGILELSSTGIIRMANTAAAEILGYMPEELIGRNVHDAMHFKYHDGSPRSSSESALIEAIESGRRMRIESDVFWRSDGSPVPVTVATHPMWRDNQAAGAVVSFFEISERVRADAAREEARQAAEALAEANHDLALQSQMNAELYNNAPCGYHSLDRDGRIINVNETELAMLGYSRDEYVGRPLADFLTPESAGLFTQRFAEFVETEKVRDLDYEMLRKDGTLLPVRISADMVRNNEGEFIYNRATLVDDSERREQSAQIAEMQVQLAERAEAAERLARVKSEFLANMSHEIRTPLNGVLGLAQLGYRDNVGRSKAQETFARILSSGKLLLTVINDILDFSKIEAGKLPIESVPLDPTHLIDDVVSTIAQLASSKGLEVIPELGSDLPSACLGDPVRISQILLNLLSNAVKFTPEGTIRIGVQREGNELVYRVIDTGVGIDPAHIGRLFMPFEQADSSTTRKFGGTGLGLAISRRLAELMGGKLQATSTIGVGSTFELHLPTRETDQIAVQNVSRPLGGVRNRLEGIRVLVAEDMEINRIVLEDFLVGEGAKVEMVENGRLAVDAVRQRPRSFDVVLADLQMPEMDGIEATRRLLKLAPQLPVIGQTAHALKEEHDRCLSAGMTAIITKPIDIEMLVTTILETVGTPDPQRSPPPLVFDVTPQPAASEIVDWGALSERYPSRPEFIDRLMAMTIETHGRDAEVLRELIAARDMAAIGRLAHTLKGVAGNIHAPIVEREAIRVMHAARSESPEALSKAPELALAIEQLISAIKKGRREPIA